jgi:predicted RNase H-like HicB family nuclease
VTITSLNTQQNPEKLRLPKKDIPHGTLKSIEKQANIIFPQGDDQMTKKDKYIYPAIFAYADDGISIEFPDLSGCLPSADTTEEAIKNAKEAMALHLYTSEQDNEIIPEPTSIEKIQTKQGQTVVLIEIWMPIYRDAIENKSIKKTGLSRILCKPILKLI